MVKLRGNYQIEERDSETTAKFFVEDVQEVGEKLMGYMMEVTSYAVFHLDIEETFKSSYATKAGHPFFIFDKAMDEIRVMNYTVKDSVAGLPNVVEM